MIGFRLSLAHEPNWRHLTYCIDFVLKLFLLVLSPANNAMMLGLNIIKLLSNAYNIIYFKHGMLVFTIRKMEGIYAAVHSM